MNPILYKRTATGSVQFWQQEIDGPRYRTITGKVGGAEVVSEWTLAKAKNTGRSNATTAEEQALLEVEANYKKQRAQGKYRDNIFDGELYNHDLHDDFNEIVSMVRKQKPSDTDLATSKDKVQYHIYDVIMDGKTFEERSRWLTENVTESDCVRIVPTCRVFKDEIDDIYDTYIQAGYEGQMLRNGLSPYQHKRTSDLLKRKEFVEKEFTIVDVIEGEGNRAGMAGAVVCQLDDRRTFKATPKGTNKHRVGLLMDKETIKGKPGTVQFFRLTPDGVPRFPVLKGVRDYE